MSTAITARSEGPVDCQAGGIPRDHVAPNATQSTLSHFVQELTVLRGRLHDPHISAEIRHSLHEPGRLPDKETAALAAQAVDLLHETERMLQPRYVSTKCLVAAVELRIPDILSKGPSTLSQLAVSARARHDRLRQTMRLLCNNDVFAHNPQTDTYSNNHRSELLRSDHWTQWHNWVELYGNEFYDIARGIPASVREDTTRSAAQHNFGTDEEMFTYFEHQGWLPRLHRTLGGGAIAQAPGIVADYPWDEVGNSTLVDIGGGGGALIASLLRNNPRMRGGVFDLHSVIKHIRPFFKAGGQFSDVGDRVSQNDLVAGDFFVQVPSYEVYVMKWCLHDWRDPEAIKLLQNIREAIVPGAKSRLVVLESIMADGEMGRLSRYGDINMMMTAKGQERDENEWRQLAGKAGWQIASIYHLRNAWVSAIEMRP